MQGVSETEAHQAAQECSQRVPSLYLSRAMLSEMCQNEQSSEACYGNRSGDNAMKNAFSDDLDHDVNRLFC